MVTTYWVVTAPWYKKINDKTDILNHLNIEHFCISETTITSNNLQVNMDQQRKYAGIFIMISDRIYGQYKKVPSWKQTYKRTIIVK